MHSACPSSGGSVREESARDDTTTKTFFTGQNTWAEFDRAAAAGSDRRASHHPSAPGYGHP